MDRYFFHTKDRESRLDVEGMALDLPTAKVEAVRLMGELLRENPAGFWDERTLRLTVTDETGRIAFALDLTATEGPSGPVSAQFRG